MSKTRFDAVTPRADWGEGVVAVVEMPEEANLERLSQRDSSPITRGVRGAPRDGRSSSTSTQRVAVDLAQLMADLRAELRCFRAKVQAARG